MNEQDEYHVLEVELARLQPVPPSTALTQRIAAQLQEAAALRKGEALVELPSARGASGPRSRGPLWVAALCGPIAAVLTYFLLAGLSKPNRNVESPEWRTQSTPAAAFDASLPSVWSYRRCISQSPSELNALLDKHTRYSQEPRPQRAGAFVDARFSFNLEDLLGEL